ncbi:phage tail family protein [Clostridiales Family XIII bacterium ASD5510]|uniref:Phage tail family protein n=1 Tax=Hominibacterium faecale TaxID=2839743 RepID=A0A9J6QZE9_9FIRM|nr:phage tail domain-containing protein [Hominibacterium faecale]MCU7380856.1 phage tail family protein [Hominibacterium faecale]
MREVKVIAKRSDGQVFSYENADWGILELDGLSFPPIEIFKKNRGFGNGAIITGKRKDAREIDIVATSRNRANNTIDRKRALAFHNSNYTFDLYITYLDTTRIAKECELQGAKCPTGNVYDRQILTVNYLAADADLFEDSSVITQFKNVYPLWHVARAYPPDGSLAFGYTENATSKIIEYLGSEPAPVVATIMATGAVEDITVKVRDISVTVRCNLGSGDVLVVDSENRIITLNGMRIPENQYNGLDLPNLLVKYGDNFMQIIAGDPGNVAFETDLKFTGRYGGI